MNDFLYVVHCNWWVSVYMMAMILKVISIWKLHQTPHADTSQMCTLLRNIKFLLKLIYSLRLGFLFSFFWFALKQKQKKLRKMYNDNWKILQLIIVRYISYRDSLLHFSISCTFVYHNLSFALFYLVDGMKKNIKLLKRKHL